LLDLVRSAMAERCTGVFAGVKAHSPLAAVEAAATALRSAEADAVVAIGGGSAAVTARAASILVAETGDARSLSTSRDERGRLHSPKLLAPKMPQLVIPTTPTTALVKSGSAVFDPSDGQRLALFDPKTRAQAVFIHPAMLASAPRALVLAASLNAFALAIEGLLSKSGDPFSDALLMHALRLLAYRMSGPDATDDTDARADLTMAAVLCGQGTDYTGGGITTVLAHAISARFALDNGIAKIIVLPHALRFNADTIQSALLKLVSCLGLQGAGAMLEAVLRAIETMCDDAALPRRLRDVGVPRNTLPEVAAHAMGDWFLRSNPRPVNDASELLEVLAAAW